MNDQHLRKAKRPCTDDDLRNPTGASCIMQDGQKLSVPLRLIDAAPCGCGTTLADSTVNVADANLESGRRTLDAMQRNADQVQARVDHYHWKDVQHQRAIDADPSASAYQRMVAGMQYGGAR